ncbi:DegQ family serine endoprotease [Caminibacter pacificus]|uniref:DegQ family serine endoprotease n=1 Tax=Caminibacter pacificus TaxID=1424653 RepID=A0AAJ4UX37_9BACT|nr:DegQ family serine endoprotease [Caminibacter pacificus]QCI27433.1 DegQ family serine endoprotease [Caminibacter pacificus]ROR38870.1 serine protease Do [Caminibacter pacificus]
MKKLALATALSAFLFAANIHLNVDKTPIKRVAPNQNGLVMSFAPIVQKVIPSVVNISTEKVVETRIPEQFRRFFEDPFLRRFFGPFGNIPNQPQKRKEFALGSGVIISKNGYIVTNYHVISGATKIIVKTHDGKKYKAKLIGSDPKTDLAVIKIDAKNLHPITFADSSKVKVGDMVLAIGNPFGLSESVTHGIVSALNRNSIGLNAYENYIQTDAAINPGNSGGALVDLKGRLIGINSAIISRSGGNNGIGFAIPSNMVKFVAVSLITKGKVVRGYLGVLISNIDSSKAKLYGIGYGVLINKVEPNSAAAKAGLKPGDIIVAVDGEKVTNAGELRNKIAFKGAGAKVKLRVYRNGKFITIEATLKALKTKQETIQNVKLLKGLTLKEEKNSVVIEKVDPNSYAAMMGLQKGDKIVRVKTIKTGKWVKVTSIDELKNLLKGLDRGDALIEVERKNQLFIVQL